MTTTDTTTDLFQIIPDNPFAPEVAVSKRHLVELIARTAGIPAFSPQNHLLFENLVVSAPDAAMSVLDRLVERNAQFTALNLLDRAWVGIYAAYEANAVDVDTYVDLVNARAELMRHEADRVNGWHTKAKAEPSDDDDDIF